MAIQKITIQQFLELAKQHPVFDVRSPGEYIHAHIPHAHNLPLFSNEERKIVGTAYKQQSRETAIKIGLDFFGVKMKAMVEEVEKIMGNGQCVISNKETTTNENQLPVANCLLLHCWRGGMRSAGVAWLLDLYGFKVYTLIGGYKAYRNWALQQFAKEYTFSIIGGYTGSGKTLLLKELEKQQKNIIDLEGIANHKGSAFGSMGNQPTQEMFENILATELSGIGHSTSGIFIEDESQRIGNLKIPDAVWKSLRNSPVFFLDIPFEERLEYITEEYGRLSKEVLVNAIIRIQKRLGGLETKNAINHLLENNTKESFRILLTYYDKWYTKGLNNRENLSAFLNKIPCKSVDTKTNVQNLLACCTVNS
ncbi:MAG: tRNA 2-selenouridine(34) synthase MnmH [Chitinophagaceae bacterium]|nr:tRNA 2-selenouridine(34) synthase MnmH [Chitinophagaceae bacterium]